MAEEIDPEMCNYGQLSKVKMLRDLDLGSGQGHININTSTVRVRLPACGVTRYRNMAIWISWNMDIRRSLNSRDSFPRRKFKNWTQTSCSPGPILSPSTISFELHSKTAEKINLEKCNFLKFGSFMALTLTLDRVEVTLVHICGRGLPTHQIRSKSEKLFVYAWTDVRMDTPDYQSTRSSTADDKKSIFLPRKLTHRLCNLAVIQWLNKNAYWEAPNQLQNHRIGNKNDVTRFLHIWLLFTSCNAVDRQVYFSSVSVHSDNESFSRQPFCATERQEKNTGLKCTVFVAVASAGLSRV